MPSFGANLSGGPEGGGQADVNGDGFIGPAEAVFIFQKCVGAR